MIFYSLIFLFSPFWRNNKNPKSSDVNRNTCSWCWGVVSLLLAFWGKGKGGIIIIIMKCFANEGKKSVQSHTFNSYFSFFWRQQKYKSVKFLLECMFYIKVKDLFKALNKFFFLLDQGLGWCRNHINFLTNQSNRYVISLIIKQQKYLCL